MDRRLKAALVLNACFEGRAGRALQRWTEEGRDPEELLGPSSALPWTSLGLPEDAGETVARRLAQGWAERELEACGRLGVRVLPWGHREIPDGMGDLSTPPGVLYLWGAQPLPGREESVGVVGTRRATAYGRRMAQALGARAGKAGFWLVSGGAGGVDGMAHEGCLAAGGHTAAVLGTGVDRVFPSGHRELFERIRGRGCLVSEYPLGTEGRPWRFPLRNRILAALVCKLAVVEAPSRSGALITARNALDLGREVWAVPGRVDEETCRGSNRLLFDGAYPLVDLEDFLPSGGQRSLFPPASPSPSLPGGLEEEGRAILGLLAREGDRTVDNLASEGRMSAASVLKVLSVLQALGWVYPSGPGRFRAAPDKGCLPTDSNP